MGGVFEPSLDVGLEERQIVVGGRTSSRCSNPDGTGGVFEPSLGAVGVAGQLPTTYEAFGLPGLSQDPSEIGGGRGQVATQVNGTHGFTRGFEAELSVVAKFVRESARSSGVLRVRGRDSKGGTGNRAAGFLAVLA